MKKKSFLVFALILIISFAFISCKNEAKPPQEHEHTFGEWTTLVEATKTEEGKRKRECSVCKYTQKENIPTTSKRAIKVPVLDKIYDGKPIALTKDAITYKGDVAAVSFQYGIKDSTGKYSPLPIPTQPRDAAIMK